MNAWLYEIATLPKLAAELSRSAALPAGARVAREESKRIRGIALAALRDRGPQRVGALAEEIGISRESMRSHLVQLAAVG